MYKYTILIRSETIPQSSLQKFQQCTFNKNTLINLSEKHSGTKHVMRKNKNVSAQNTV